jgi:hypothetical protein
MRNNCMRNVLWEPIPGLGIARHVAVCLDRAVVRQRKTGGPLRFELTDQARQDLDADLHLTVRQPGQFLFTGRDPIRQYARLVGRLANVHRPDPCCGNFIIVRGEVALRRKSKSNYKAKQYGRPQLALRSRRLWTSVARCDRG